MKTKINCLIIILLLTVVFAKSQTIDYSYEQISTTSCNIFASATTIDNFEHLTTLSRPKFADNSVVLECKPNSSSTLLSTIYSIKYNFKAGYNYKISVYYKGTLTTPDALYPSVGLLIGTTNGGTDAGTNCIAPSQFSLSNANNFIQSTANGTYAWANNIINSTLTQNADFLIVGGFPTFSTTQTGKIYVRKIQIVETAVNPPFTLTPNSISTTCGTGFTQTFTVNNVNNLSVSSYVWNIGNNSGWLYNGSPANTTITTSTNTLTLTSNGCSTLSNIYVTANVGSSTYMTNYSAVSTSLPTFSISGASSFCSGPEVYSISSLPCSATVTWLPSPSNLVTMSTSNNQASLTRAYDGTISLSAIINNACGTNDIQVAPITNIQVGGNPITVTASQNSCDQVTFTATGGASNTTYNWSSLNGTILYNGTSTIATTSTNYIDAYITSASDYAILTVNNSCSQSVNTGVNYAPFERQIQGLYPEYVSNDHVSVLVNTTQYDTYYRWYVNNTLVKEGSNADMYCTCSNEPPDTRVCGENTIRVEVETNCNITTSSNVEYFQKLCYYRLSKEKDQATLATQSITKDEIGISKLSIYPNPANNLLNISLPDSINTLKATIQLIDIYGKVVKKITTVSKSNTIPMYSLPSGMYLVEIYDGSKKIIIQKIIKQ